MTAVETVTLRRIGRHFGFADVRLPAVHLRGLMVAEGADGRLHIRAPEVVGCSGFRRSACEPQPVWQEAIAAQIAALWART